MSSNELHMSIARWQTQPSKHAKATQDIHDVDGTWAAAGAVGEVCDVDSVNNVVFVDFGSGALPCWADEITPVGAPDEQ